MSRGEGSRAEAVKAYGSVTDTLVPRSDASDALLLVEIEAQLASKLDGTTIQIGGRTVEARISKALSAAGLESCPGDRVAILLNPDPSVRRVSPIIWRERGTGLPERLA